MVYSASSVVALKGHGADSYFLLRHLFWIAVGGGLLFLVSRIPFRFWQEAVLPLTLLCLLLLGLVLIPGIGQEINGARRWLRIGPVSFQPSEFAKLGFIIYLAHYLSRGPDRLSDLGRGLLPVLSVVGLGVLLILSEPDLGTAFSLALVSLLLLFVGGAKITCRVILYRASNPLDCLRTTFKKSSQKPISPKETMVNSTSQT